MSSYSGLGERDRATARRLIVKGVEVLMAHTAGLHYAQDMVQRWEGIRNEVIPWTQTGRINGRYPKHGDCSSTATYLLWLALEHHFHLPDRVNGTGWRSGWTGSMIEHGKPVHDWSKLKIGDAIIYGPARSDTKHVTVSIGGRRAFSHGSEGGPYIVDFKYRRDIVGVRRYI